MESPTEGLLVQWGLQHAIPVKTSREGY